MSKRNYTQIKELFPTIQAMAQKAAEEFGAVIIPTGEIYAQQCDIFSPNAMGAILNPTTIPMLNCKVVAGGANNQILDDASGIALKQRGIFYTPVFVWIRLLL